MKTRSSRVVSVVIILILLIILTSGCQENAKPTHAYTGNTNAPEKVKIGYSLLRISLPIFVAEEKGIFKKNGLKVDLEEFDTAQTLMDALIGGKIDVGGYTAFPITFSAQLRSKKDLYYATAMMEDDKHPISMFVVKKDSPISSIKDLKGKRIGILPTLAYKVWLETILKENGISPEEVTIKQISPAMTPFALQSGVVDAMFTNDPAVTATLHQGIGKLLYKGAIVPRYWGEPFPFGSFNMTKDFVKKDPQTAKKIVESLDEAIDYINSNQLEAKKMMAKFLPDDQKSFVENYPDALYIKSTEFTPSKLMKVVDLYRKQGIINGSIDLTNFDYRYTP